MKIRKLLLIIIGIFCFIPVVKAEDDIVVKKAKLMEATDEVNSKSTSKINLVFNDLGQNATYEVTIKNNTDKDLSISDLIVTNSKENFIKYTISEKDKSKIIKSNRTTKIELSIDTLEIEGAGRNLANEVKLKFVLKEAIKNPETSSNSAGMIVLVIVLSVGLALVMMKTTSNKVKTVSIIACFMVLGISSVFAATKEYNASLTAKIAYKSQNLLETTGTTILNHKANYATSKDIWVYNDKVKNIHIKSILTEQKNYKEKFDLTIDDKNRVVGYLVENGDGLVPYDLYIMSNGVIYAPEDSTGLFSFPNVETINGLENIMFDNTIKMTGMFIGNERLNTVDLSTLDTTNVKDTSYMFHKCYNYDVDENKFNLENVEIKNNMFVQYLKDEIIKDAKTDKNIDFSQPSKYVSSYKESHASTTESISMSSSSKYYYGSGYTFDSATGKYNLTGTTSGTWSTMSSKHATYPYTCKYTSESACSTLYKMTGYTNTTTGVGYKYTREAIYTENGQGLYIRTGTEKDKNPIYYYRGAVTNNNVKFAGFCWKMVRTTESGGIKLIYNGIPNSSGSCSNTGEASQIGKSTFNSSDVSPAYVGYMYGAVYNKSEKAAANITAGMVFGNDIEYKDGKYYLKSTYTLENGWAADYKTISTRYHYTCFGTGTSCETINYIYYAGKSNAAYYIPLTGGKTQLDLLNEMLTNSTNENSSTIKTTIDTWYKNNMINYTSYLEDTVWCNDRSIHQLNGWKKDLSANYYLYFGAYGRNGSSYKPSLKCTNLNDRFTVSSENGNGKLTYPVALLTADELVLAGAKNGENNSNFYLNTGQDWWTLSPNHFNNNAARDFYSHSYGAMYSNTVNFSHGVRPAVSLKAGIDYVTGTGTVSNPYIVE